MRHSPFRKVYLAISLIIITLITGITGFMWIEGYSFLDAMYMTVITVATVGFQEVQPLSGAGRMFTTFLIVTSFGTFAFGFAAISRYILDGEFNSYFRNFKVANEISKLENHVIICGFGRNGKQAAHVMKNHGQRFVVVESKSEVIATMSSKYRELVMQGDSTQDEVLQLAGIEKARALITTLPVDADNLFIVLSARALNPKLIIISRASDDNSDKKLKIAGANNVIMPDKLGGAHMASLVMKPDVMEFIDFVTGQGGDNIRLEEITFENLPDHLKNKTIKDLEIRNKSGANIIGFKTGNGEYIINPSPDNEMIPHAKLFVLGTADQINKLKEIFAH